MGRYMKPKSPAFQFYPGDWLSDENVVLMSNAARGLYITLLCHCWLEGSIPADLDKLSKISNEKRKKFEKIWREVESCFSKNGDTGRYVNNRLERERTKQEYYRKERSESGKLGANKRWLSHSSPIKQPLAKNSSSSSSSSSIKKNKYIESVFLSQEEYDKLKIGHGEFLLTKAIDLLNNYKMATGKKYKSDYHALLNWAIEKAKGGQDAGVRGNTKEVATESRITAEARELARQATERAEQVMRDRRANESADNPNNPHP